LSPTMAARAPDRRGVASRLGNLIGRIEYIRCAGRWLVVRKGLDLDCHESMLSAHHTATALERKSFVRVHISFLTSNQRKPKPSAPANRRSRRPWARPLPALSRYATLGTLRLASPTRAIASRLSRSDAFVATRRPSGADILIGINDTAWTAPYVNASSGI
jgi:hypothetical protein